MKIISARFIRSGFLPSDFPADGLPEIAFLGRSNVGKSSLMNSLLGVKGLARTSSTPGRTQAINFFLINERFYFVDLPGYGYAKVPLAIKREWGPMVENYLAKRPPLMLSIAIVDSRHKPTAQDLQLITWLKEQRLNYISVATKADKLSNNQLRKALAEVQAVLQPNELLAYSSETKLGLERLWRKIDDSLKNLTGGKRERKADE